MPSQTPRKIKPPSSGMFEGVALRIKLILRLLVDPRVNIFLKLLPVFSLLYLFIPDLLIGPLDDAAVVWLGFTLFVELCPPQVVEEHTRALKAAIDGSWKEPPGSSHVKDDDVIEGEFRDLNDPGEIWDNGFKEKHENKK
jgi:uncharacterized membrane protein YkvA (DUF1232 family)